MVISVVSFSFSCCSTGGPGAQLSAECWLSLPHPVTNGSGLQNSDLLLVFTELYNSSIAHSISPHTGHRNVSLPLSLEWHVWLSSSGNNCHAVHRSLSSGASVWLYRGILPCPILSANSAYANGICNFRVFRMECLAGSKVNIQHYLTLIIQHNSLICTQSNSFKYCFAISINEILHTVKEFQVLLSNI